MEAPAAIGTSVFLVSADPAWVQHASALLQQLNLQVVGTCEPSATPGPATITLVDARGIIPNASARTLLALPPDAPAPANVGHVRWPPSPEDLKAAIERELAALRQGGVNIDPWFRLAALEQIVGLMTESVEFVDDEIRLLDVNPAFESITGYRRDQAIGRTTRELFRTPSHDPAMYEEISKVLRDGDVWRGQMVARRANGTMSYQTAILSPVRVSGETAGYVALKRDVDRDELALQAFAGKTDRLTALIQGAADPIFLHDFDGRIFDGNKSALAYVGVEAFASADANLLQQFTPESQRALLRSWGGAERSRPIELDCGSAEVNEDGAPIKILSVRSGLLSIGGERMLVSVARDVTEKHRLAIQLRAQTRELEATVTALREAQDALLEKGKREAALVERARSLRIIEERQTWFRAIFEEARDAMIITDGGGTIVDVNPAATTLTQRDKTSLVGQPLTFIFEEGSHELADDLVRSLNEASPPTELMEAVVVSSAGVRREVSVNAAHVRIHDAPFLHIVARDVTNQNRAEHERAQLEQRLQQSQKLEALGTLAGGIAHDFNNLLGPIVAYAEMLESVTAAESEAEEMRQDIVTAAERAADLVRRILHFSRRSEGQPKVLYVAEVVTEVARLLERTLPPGLVLRFEALDVTARVECDPTELQQVVMNIATNALHAMEDAPGVLTIEVTRLVLDPPRGLQSESETPLVGEFVKVSVTDTGHGMSPEIQQRVFEPYFSTKTSTRGTGLGLATVFGLVQQMGGTIRIESAVGEGSRFDVYIPASEKAVEADAAGTAASHRTALGIRSAIVVDDEPANIRMMERLLATAEIEMTGFTDPRTAVEFICSATKEVDVIITDLTMPSMNGIELIEQVRHTAPHLPIIIYTGYGDERSEARAIAAGARMMLRKPVTRRVLMDALATLVDEGFVKAARAGHSGTFTRVEP